VFFTLLKPDPSNDPRFHCGPTAIPEGLVLLAEGVTLACGAIIYSFPIGEIIELVKGALENWLPVTTPEGLGLLSVCGTVGSGLNVFLSRVNVSNILFP
jgi:hypothetical protein